MGTSRPKVLRALADFPQSPTMANEFCPFVPSCSVVVCTRNRPVELARCLAALAQVRYPRFDVLVVDNAPSDARAHEIALRWGASYVVEPVAGLSRARNRGASISDAEIIAFVDDDALPEPAWLSALACEFRDPTVMAVTGQIYALRIETEAERLAAATGGPAAGGYERRVVDRHRPAWFELANFGGIGNGGNMAFRRRVFAVWPGFDERLGRGAPLDGGEEHYAFFALIDRGYRVVYTPRAVVRHPYPQTLAELRARHLKGLSASSAYIVLLFVEQPRYRRTVLKYLLEWLRGTRRSWRGPTASQRPRIVSRWRTLTAWFYGPVLYVAARATPTLSAFAARCTPTGGPIPHAPVRWRPNSSARS